MSGVSDDLATILAEITKGAHEGGHHPRCATRADEGCDCYARATLPARQALARVEAELARLRSDKDERDWRTLEIVTARAVAAEAECARLLQEQARLRQELEQARECCARPPGTCFNPEALAGPDTPEEEA